MITHSCKFIYSKCDEIFVSSHGFKKLFFKLLKRDVYYVPQWAEDNFKYVYRCQKKKEKINIFFAGNLGYAHNIDVLKKLFIKLKNSNIADFYIFSNGRKIQELSYFIKKKQIRNVILNNYLSLNNYFNASKKCDLFLITLRNKKVFNHTMPARLSTAFAMGLPVISYGSDEVRRLIESSRAGFAVKSSNLNVLVSKIVKFYKLSSIEKKKIKKNSFQFYKRNLNKKKLIKKINTIMNY